MSEIEHTSQPFQGRSGSDDERDERWSALLAQVGGEIAGPLTAALERVDQLAATGRIDRPSLRALRTEVETARRAAMLGQQLARYASGRVKQRHERVELAQVIRDVLLQRQRETDARGLQVRTSLKPAEVIVDASLLFALMQSVLDWSIGVARGAIELALERKAWRPHARLRVRLAHRPADESTEPRAPECVAPLDTLPWHLTHHIAGAMGLRVERHDEASETVLVLEFPRTVNEAMEGASVIELDSGLASALDSKPLAGSHVLVVASQREMRQRVWDAIGSMGLIVDFVASVDEGLALCAGGLPHAIVHASEIEGARIDDLQDEIRRQAADVVFIEITREGPGFEVSGFHGASSARVGINEIATRLPSALLFELSRNL